MFQHHSKKSSASTPATSTIYKVASIEQLFNDEKRMQLIQRMRESSGLSEERFTRLCLSSIHNFVNHCQNLPETTNSYYSQPGGIVDYALNRADAALNLFKRYLIVSEKSGLSEEQLLWQYALFSAALFLGIGKIQVDYAVNIYDKHNQELKLWNPLLETISEIGSHYGYNFLKESDVELRRRLNSLLAVKLMPKAGFAWIASNPRVLAVWLALLNEDAHSARSLGAILITADAMAIQRFLNFLFAKKQGVFDSRPYKLTSLLASETPKVSNIEHQISADFTKWLSTSLDSGELVINKDGLDLSTKGLEINAKIFKAFANIKNLNWKAVEKAFLSLKLHVQTAAGEITNKVERSSQEAAKTGVLVAKFAALMPSKVQFYNPHTKKTSEMPIEELVHNSQVSTVTTSALELLDSKGKWVENQDRLPVKSTTFRPSSRG